MLLSSAVLGVGIGRAFSALGNLIVQAVPASQTGIASGMNTVLRTLGGALALVCWVGAGLLIPVTSRRAIEPAPVADAG
ncbi:MAG: hypothetical protein ACTHKL_17910 [Streptosporangiaceae bacterium]